jgi:hypothetical protein
MTFRPAKLHDGQVISLIRSQALRPKSPLMEILFFYIHLRIARIRDSIYPPDPALSENFFCHQGRVANETSPLWTLKRQQFIEQIVLQF